MGLDRQRARARDRRIGGAWRHPWHARRRAVPGRPAKPGPGHAVPIFDSPQDTASAIEAFAAAAVRDAAARRIATPSARSASRRASRTATMRPRPWPRLAGRGRAGRPSIEAASWRGDGEPINAASGARSAAWVPYSFLFDGLDPTSAETALAYPADRGAATMPSCSRGPWTRRPSGSNQRRRTAHGKGWTERESQPTRWAATKVAAG